MKKDHNYFANRNITFLIQLQNRNITACKSAIRSPYGFQFARKFASRVTSVKTSTFIYLHADICVKTSVHLFLVAKNEAPLIILEYCPHGNLREFLRTKRDIYEPEWKDVDNVQFSITDVANFALHIAKGMEFLISRKVAYNIIFVKFL